MIIVIDIIIAFDIECLSLYRRCCRLSTEPAQLLMCLCLTELTFNNGSIQEEGVVWTPENPCKRSWYR